MNDASVPPEVADAAIQRSEARTRRDWATADRLKAQIETAGFRVIDRGARYRLELAHPPDVVAGEVVRYGRTDSVPSRLVQPATRAATIVTVADAGQSPAVAVALARLVDDGSAAESSNASVVVVANGVGERAGAELERALDPKRVDVVRMIARMGRATALNAGIRRTDGAVVILAASTAHITVAVVTRLVGALDDPGVAVSCVAGYVSPDLRHFARADAASSGEVAAIAWPIVAFRRSEFLARGPLDERFESSAWLDAWWSLVLRDEGEGRQPRGATALDAVQSTVSASAGDSAMEARDRAERRNYYRLIERFGGRRDLAVGPALGVIAEP